MRRGLLVGAVLALVAWLGVGWYYASQALAPGGLRVVEFDHRVYGDVADGRLLLTASSDARLPVVGVAWAGGYGRLTGEVEVVPCPDADVECVVRDFRLLTGTPPAGGTLVDVDEYAFPPGAPSEALGVEVAGLPVEVPGGTAPAWWVPPTGSDVVAVLVHGRGSSRDEMLRVASELLPMGYGILVPSYRGDGVGPEPEGGIGRFGTQEWLDVAMAMLHPEVPADARFVLVGNSQGGALAASLLAEADVAARVEALVLDSPLIGLDRTMQLQARLAGIPEPLVRPVLEGAYVVSRLRGFDFGEGEHVEALAELDLPVLLFHGPDDTFVPVGPSDDLAALDPAQVTYVRIDGIDHVRFWNHDPDAYGDAVRGFLAANVG